MSGMGLHVSGHAGSKSHQHCRQWTWKRRHRGRRPEETQVRRLEFDVQLCSSRCRDVRSLGEDADDFVHELGRRITAVTGERRATEFLLQRLSVAIQRGNAIAVQGITDSKSDRQQNFNIHTTCNKTVLQGCLHETTGIDLGGGGVQCSAHGPFIGQSKRFWNFSNISSNARDKLIVILMPIRLRSVDLERSGPYDNPTPSEAILPPPSSAGYFDDMKKKVLWSLPVRTIIRHPAKRSYRHPRKLDNLCKRGVAPDC